MTSNADSRLPAIEQSEQSEQSNNLSLTLKSWPIIALLTIGLCYLTQLVAGWFGIELPDQQNIDIVRRCGLHAFDSLKNFCVFAFLCVQVIVLLPAAEEFVFRGLLFKLPRHLASKHQRGSGVLAASEQRGSGVLAACQKPAPWAIISSALFSAAHYLAQPWPDAAFLALFFFGLAQCWLYKKTDRIWCAMLNHGLFNLTNLILLFIIPEST